MKFKNNLDYINSVLSYARYIAVEEGKDEAQSFIKRMFYTHFLGRKDK